MSIIYEKISTTSMLHGQTSVNTDIPPYSRTFGRELNVYNTATQFYGHMSANDAFIMQATVLRSARLRKC